MDASADRWIDLSMRTLKRKNETIFFIYVHHARIYQSIYIYIYHDDRCAFLCVSTCDDDVCPYDAASCFVAIDWRGDISFLLSIDMSRVWQLSSLLVEAPHLNDGRF
jgi:hypothetical protein